MGKKSRRRRESVAKKPKRVEIPYVERPFEGLPGETDWVSMREIIPAATATARLTAEHGGEDVLVVTMLPEMWPAMRRSDGRLLVALQTAGGGRGVDGRVLPGGARPRPPHGGAGGGGGPRRTEAAQEGPGEAPSGGPAVRRPANRGGLGRCQPRRRRRAATGQGRRAGRPH